ERFLPREAARRPLQGVQKQVGTFFQNVRLTFSRRADWEEMSQTARRARPCLLDNIRFAPATLAAMPSMSLAPLAPLWKFVDTIARNLIGYGREASFIVVMTPVFRSALLGLMASVVAPAALQAAPDEASSWSLMQFQRAEDIRIADRAFSSSFDLFYT